MKEKLHISTFSLISQCVLCYNTGLVNRFGSPFGQLNRMHPELGLPMNNRRKAIIKIYESLNEDYHLPPSLHRTIEKIKE